MLRLQLAISQAAGYTSPSPPPTGPYQALRLLGPSPRLGISGGAE